MRVERHALLQTLEQALPGLSTRGILEQSDCFVFTKKFIITYNEELSCKVPNLVGPGVTGVVPAEPLLTFLRKAKDPEVDVVVEGTKLVLVGSKRRRCTILLEAEVNLPVGAVEKVEKWKPLPAAFLDAVGVVEKCAGKDQSDEETTCLHLHPKWVEASDRFQLCRWPLKTGLGRPVLVRRDAIKHVPAAGPVEFAETEHWLHFKNQAGLVMSCRLYLGDYRDLGEFIELEGARPVSLTKGLAQAAELAGEFCKDNPDGAEVEVSLKPGRLKVRGEGSRAWYEEPRKVDYQGPPMSFLIAPKILADVAKQHEQCLVTDTRLKVKTDRYVYVACLNQVEEAKS